MVIIISVGAALDARLAVYWQRVHARVGVPGRYRDLHTLFSGAAGVGGRGRLRSDRSLPAMGQPRAIGDCNR